MNAAIHVDHLNKTFARKTALVDLELTIAAGEMVALIGASGSGNSDMVSSYPSTVSQWTVSMNKAQGGYEATVYAVCAAVPAS